ncbi:hypothetical protein [Deminuibacter soli]|uniref:Lipoprotein n=1 Tax=Deminuibacter soli TaxID=2291815 RepID=A0A3E1NPW0_9BACT|nr:hypothetical protein [Deminuibacter soli]RFM29937.1 hypothetical protein DXN05_02890 [Deminuibacter soli]
MKVTQMLFQGRQVQALLCAACFALLLTSCKKNESEATAGTEITTDDAADMIQTAVNPETLGITAQMRTTTVYSNARNFQCSIESDTTATGQGTVGAATYSYYFNWARLYKCDLQTLVISYNGNTSYDVPLLLSGTDTSFATFTVTGLKDTSYKMDATYERFGTHTSHLRNKNTFNGHTTITAKALPVSKITGEIESGTAAVTFTGAGTGGTKVNLTGTLTFTGNKKGVLVLGGNYTRNLSW